MSIFKTALPCVLENRSDRSGPSKKFSEIVEVLPPKTKKNVATKRHTKTTFQWRCRKRLKGIKTFINFVTQRTPPRLKVCLKLRF